jgi:hypothetical protein
LNAEISVSLSQLTAQLQFVKQIGRTRNNRTLKEKCMTRNRLPKAARLSAGLLTGLLFAALAAPLGAQPVPQNHPYYDIAKEVTLAGTVSEVYAHPGDGMIFGSHLMLETASGRLDASLGKWAMQGKGALSVAAGQPVEVTGVMKTIKDKQVFIVRIVKAEGHLYTIRNKFGLPTPPQSRERASKIAAQKGESL